jgi:clan AA aspartic protease (TIGR02281 family)
MLKKIFISTLLLFTVVFSFGQTILKLKKDGGIYLVPCKINGLDFDLYFDTGASLVSISLKEAKKLIAAGKLKADDIIGKTQMTIANGQFVNGTIILIRELKVGDLVLKDIEAVITESQTAPLLLGQSAINRFGEFTFDYSTETLKINKFSNSNSSISSIPKLNEQYKKGLNTIEIASYEFFYNHRSEIVRNLVVEIAKFNIFKFSGDNHVDFSFDITNNTDYDFIYMAQLKCEPMKKVSIVVTVYTEEGKIYTQTVLFANQDLPAHTTNSMFATQINIRSNTIKGVKVRVVDENF